MALKKSSVRLICLSAFYVCFLLVGAAIFSAIEGPIEMKRLRELLAARTKFLQNRRECLSGLFSLPVCLLPYGICVLLDFVNYAIVCRCYAIIALYADDCYNSSA